MATPTYDINDNSEAAIHYRRFGTPTPKTTGITTSDDAANRAKSANETLDSISKKVKSQYTTTDGQKVTLYTDGTKTYSDGGSTTKKTDTKTSPTSDVFASLYEQIGVLQQNLNKAKEAEKAAKEEAAGLDAASALKKKTSSEEVATQGQADLTAAGNAINGEGNTSGIFDPMIKMYTDTFINNANIIQNQAKTLEQYREQFNEYTQQDIDSIVRTAARSVATQEAENKRTTDAMRFAGVLGGRAQFAPVTEQSIIKDVIQEGLDKIEVINEKKNTAIREARKAEAEFNIDVFEQQAELAKEYNNQIQETFSALNAHVRQVEQDERERLTFRQQQEERNSLILAEELVDATPEQIMQAAAANGIDVGLLTKAVNDARYEKANREFEEKSNALTLEEQRASIANKWKDYNDNGDEKEIKIPEDVEQGLRSVAQLSQQDREDIWMDIQDFGLNQDAVSFWLEDRGYNKSQVKGIIKAHEQSQRIKGTDAAGNEDVYLSTETETALFDFVDKYKTAKNKKAENELTDIVSKRKYGTVGDTKPKVGSKYGGDTIMSPETFFKKN
jgi:hypothetical protein